jgi:DNA-binding transcriptional ArsR family regulator
LSSDQLDERLRALGHPVRRELFAACLREARPAGELVELVDLAPASVSEHLKVLRKSGLLVLERDGRFRRYRADPEVARAVASALAELADAAAATSARALRRRSDRSRR